MDIEYLLLLQNLRAATGDAFTSLFSFITTLGEGFILTLVMAAVYWCVSKRDGIYVLFAYQTGRLLNGFVKIIACVYRPWIRDGRVTPVPSAMTTATGYSFPSGHSASAVGVWGALAARPAVKKGLKAVLIALVLLSGFSRNYLGVHTPQDVIVSFALGAAILWPLTRLEADLAAHPEKDVRVLAGGLFLCVALAILATFKSYPLDYAQSGELIVDPAKMVTNSYKAVGGVAGFLAGWFLERRLIRFAIPADWQARVLRFALGAGGYLLVNFTISPQISVALGGPAGVIASSFFDMFYVLALFPLLLRLWDDGKKRRERAPAR